MCILLCQKDTSTGDVQNGKHLCVLHHHGVAGGKVGSVAETEKRTERAREGCGRGKHSESNIMKFVD